MSPYAFHQFWLNRADAEVPGLLRVFTLRSREEIEDLEREIAERPKVHIWRSDAAGWYDPKDALPEWPEGKRPQS